MHFFVQLCSLNCFLEDMFNKSKKTLMSLKNAEI